MIYLYCPPCQLTDDFILVSILIIAPELYTVIEKSIQYIKVKVFSQ